MCFYDYIINYISVLYQDQWLLVTSAGPPEPRGKKASLLFGRKKKKKKKKASREKVSKGRNRVARKQYTLQKEKELSSEINNGPEDI